MTSEAKRTLAASLERIAAELDGAEERGKKKAEENADAAGRTGAARDEFVAMFTSAWIADQTRRSAYAIRQAVSIYMTPPSRGRR